MGPRLHLRGRGRSASPLPTAGSAPSSSVPCMRAVRITRFGGPEVLDVVDQPDPVPGDGEQLYEVGAAGINFVDTHHRRSAQRTTLETCGWSTSPRPTGLVP